MTPSTLGHRGLLSLALGELAAKVGYGLLRIG